MGSDKSAGQIDAKWGPVWALGFDILTWALTLGLLDRALVSSPGLVLPLAGCVAWANYFPSLGPSLALRGSSACLGSVRWEVAALCQ